MRIINDNLNKDAIAKLVDKYLDKKKERPRRKT